MNDGLLHQAPQWKLAPPFFSRVFACQNQSRISASPMLASLERVAPLLSLSPVWARPSVRVVKASHVSHSTTMMMLRVESVLVWVVVVVVVVVMFVVVVVVVVVLMV